MQFPLLDFTLHSIQFAAILGDLVHKQDIYIATQSFAPFVTCAFSNCNQAHFLLTAHPLLVPPGSWSNHSLGTFFEYYYYSNLTLRFSYPSSQPVCVC
jgi:hypothetical protein